MTMVMATTKTVTTTLTMTTLRLKVKSGAAPMRRGKLQVSDFVSLPHHFPSLGSPATGKQTNIVLGNPQHSAVSSSHP